MSLDLVEADPRTKLQAKVAQPIQTEERPFDPSNFPPGQCKHMSTWIASKFAKILARAVQEEPIQ